MEVDISRNSNDLFRYCVRLQSDGWTYQGYVSDIAIFVLKRDVKLQLTNYRPSSMVCRSVTVVSPVKTAKPIEMSFGLWARVGSKNHVLDAVHIPRGKGQFLGEKRCAKRLN